MKEFKTFFLCHFVKNICVAHVIFVRMHLIKFWTCLNKILLDMCLRVTHITCATSGQSLPTLPINKNYIFGFQN